jgi:hypothetical protein
MKTPSGKDHCSMVDPLATLRDVKTVKAYKQNGSSEKY